MCVCMFCERSALFFLYFKKKKKKKKKTNGVEK